MLLETAADHFSTRCRKTPAANLVFNVKKQISFSLVSHEKKVSKNPFIYLFVPKISV